MAENRVEANAHNAGGCPASNAIHGHINDFLVRTGLRSGVSELQLPCFTAVRAEIALMSGSAFAVTHHAFSSGAGRTSDGNGSHASTLKSPSYTKSVSWQHYPRQELLNRLLSGKKLTGRDEKDIRRLWQEKVDAMQESATRQREQDTIRKFTEEKKSE